MIAPPHVTLLAIGLLAVPAAALPQYAESKWTVDEDGATCARYRYWLWSEEVVEEYRIQGLQQKGAGSDSEEVDVMDPVREEVGFLELVQLDPVYGLANLVLTGGFSGLNQMDAQTWFRRHGLDLSITGMHEWTRQKLDEAAKDGRHADLEARVGVVAMHQMRVGVYFPSVIDKHMQPGFASPRQEAEVSDLWDTGFGPTRSATELPETVEVPGKAHIWARIDCTSLRLEPLLLAARQDLSSSSWQAAINSGNASPAQVRMAQLFADAPGILPYELTRLIGTYWIDHALIAVRVGEQGPLFWVRIYGEFDAPRISSVLEDNARIHDEQLPGFAVDVTPTALTFQSKAFADGDPETRATAGSKALSAEMSVRPFWSSLRQRHDLLDADIALATPLLTARLSAGSKAGAEKLAEALRSLPSDDDVGKAMDLHGVEKWPHGLGELGKDAWAKREFARIWKVEHDRDVVQVSLDLSQLPPSIAVRVARQLMWMAMENW